MSYIMFFLFAIVLFLVSKASCNDEETRNSLQWLSDGDLKRYEDTPSIARRSADQMENLVDEDYDEVSDMKSNEDEAKDDRRKRSLFDRRESEDDYNVLALLMPVSRLLGSTLSDVTDTAYNAAKGVLSEKRLRGKRPKTKPNTKAPEIEEEPETRKKPDTEEPETAEEPDTEEPETAKKSAIEAPETAEKS